ncbi:glutaredoxin [Candidatus Woesearchaeota archaeon]|nr:glutaredoxin [Candidatus Woesearchaeota archaeon]
MMAKAKVYTKTYCPYCSRAKQMLESAGIEYEEIQLKTPEEFDALKKRTGHMTVPQVFIDDKFIGGSDDLEKWLEKEKK